MLPFLSIIIPTYNRAEKLEQCLRSLHRQNLAPGSFEVLVVDDGSTDSTPLVLKKWAEEWECLKAYHQKNSGQGRARNKALSEAKGQIILFIGDDIYPQEGFLAKHAEFHQSHPEKEYAALGLTEWDPSNEVTPFMHWLTHGGPQFAYHRLGPNEEADFRYFYTSNLSIKAEFLMSDRFDTNFKSYGFEDTELGYRLAKKGMKLVFIPAALAFHDHPMNESSLKEKMNSIGESAVIFQKKHPEIEVNPRGLKRMILLLLSSAPLVSLAWFLKTAVPFLFRRFYWALLSKRYFFEGTRRV